MKKQLVSALLGSLSLLALRADPPPARAIFDGHTLEGWTGSARSWRVEDGAITGEIRAGESLAGNEFIFWQGELNDFGPDLTGSWRNGVDFQLNVLTLRDGSVLSGMVERETETAYVVRTPTEVRSVPKADVTQRKALAQSLMPAGLLDQLKERDAIELLMFLTDKP